MILQISVFLDDLGRGKVAILKMGLVGYNACKEVNKSKF